MNIITIHLQPEIEQSLEAIASKLDRSKGWIINQALSEYIEKQQLEQERWNQTLEAMESAAQGKLVDANEVQDWLNSWGTESEQEIYGTALGRHIMNRLTKEERALLYALDPGEFDSVAQARAVSDCG